MCSNSKFMYLQLHKIIQMEADPEPRAVNLSFMWISYQCPNFPGQLMYFGTLTT